MQYGKNLLKKANFFDIVRIVVFYVSLREARVGDYQRDVANILEEQDQSPEIEQIGELAVIYFRQEDAINQIDDHYFHYDERQVRDTNHYTRLRSLFIVPEAVKVAKFSRSGVQGVGSLTLLEEVELLLGAALVALKRLLLHFLFCRVICPRLYLQVIALLALILFHPRRI